MLRLPVCRNSWPSTLLFLMDSGFICSFGGGIISRDTRSSPNRSGMSFRGERRGLASSPSYYVSPFEVRSDQVESPYVLGIERGTFPQILSALYFLPLSSSHIASKTTPPYGSCSLYLLIFFPLLSFRAY